MDFFSGTIKRYATFHRDRARARYRQWSRFLTKVFFLIVCINFLIMIFAFTAMSLVKKNAVTILVPPQSHLPQLATRLLQRNLIHERWQFVLMGRLFGFGGELRFGKYIIQPGMTALDLLKNISQGKGVVTQPLRIGAGWTISQVLGRLSQDDAVKHTITDPKLYLALEGRLSTDTFNFAWGEKDTQVLTYALHRRDAFLQNAWKNRAKGLPYTSSQQALVMASLIETEAAKASDRAKIASVLINRLRKHMPLQVDTTVLYGLDKPYGSQLALRDLTKKSPYNTYLHYGLPPAPIAMPSRASILAALHPAHTQYLYYVANGRGGHVFSHDYRQHRKAIQRYHRVITAQKIQEQRQQNYLNRVIIAISFI